MAVKVIFITATGAGTFTIPADWSSTNSIEVIGAGGGGRSSTTGGAGGGGGGQYRKLTNVAGLSGTINLAVGAGGTAGVAGGNTWWGSTTFAGATVSAQGGLGATSASGAAGGSTGVGGTGFNGGTGGLGGATALTGGGGGGGGGPGGNGAQGGAGDNTTSGADFGGGGGSGAGTSTAGNVGGPGTTSAGAGGTNGSGGGPGGAGGSGAGVTPVAGTGVWTSTHLPNDTVSVVTKSTGGGGGGGGSAAGAGGSANAANCHGGGGGGAGNGTGGTGGPGLIVITYQTGDEGTGSSATFANCVLHYPFDDTTTTDTSGNSNTGILTGTGTTLSTGLIGGKLTFNGSGYVTFTSVSLLKLATATSELSACCWMRSTQVDSTLLSLRNASLGLLDFVVGYNGVDNLNTGKLSCVIRGDSGTYTIVTSTTTVNDGSWHHVAFTRNSSKLLTIYIDGVSAGSITDVVPGALTPDLANSGIGREIFAGGRNYIGPLDDFQIYSRALTSTEINSIYVAGTTIAATGTLAATEASDVAAFPSGLVGLIGTLAQTEGADVASVAGTVTGGVSITQTGSTLQFGFSNAANTGTVSSTITVPADAEIAVVAISTFGLVGTPFYMSGGTVTLTKGGSQVAMTSAGGGGDAGNTWQCAMWYMALPDTGTNKTLTWDWVGASSSDAGPKNWSITFWKGIDTASPVRDGDGAQSTSTWPVTTPTLTAASGDLIVAFCGFNHDPGNGAGTVDSWSNLTELIEVTHQQYAEGAWATGSPSGNTTVGAATGTATTPQPAIMAVVLKPAAAATLAFQKAVTTSGAATSRSLPFTSIASSAGQERLVALVSICQAVATPVTYTTVDIDGQHATQVGPYVRATDSVGNGPIVSFWRAPGTANTSINVTFSIATGTVFDARGVLWNLNDAGTLLDFTTATGTAESAGDDINLSLNIDTVANGAVAAAFIAYNNSSGAATWTGLTERYDGIADALYGVDWVGAADLNVSSGSTPLTVTADLTTGFGGGSAAAGLAVSFNPAAGTGISGTLAATEGPDVAVLAGLVGRIGTLAVTEASDVAAFPGATVAWNATLAATEAADTAAIAGLVGRNGTLATTEGADVAAFPAGTVAWLAVLAATEGADVAVLNGLVGRIGTLATAEAADTASLDGSVRWSAVLAATEGPDVAAFPGALVRWLGTLAATEASDAAAVAGTVQWFGTLAATEAADVASFNGSVAFADQIVGSIAAIEAADAASLAGTVTGVAGALAATEATDTAAATGTVAWAAALAATEASDTASLAGTVRWQAVLAATEAADAASFAGSLLSAVSGTLAATEGPDTALFSAGAINTGTLAATEAMDTAAIAGAILSAVTGTLAATEARDTAFFSAGALNTGILAATDAPDTAAANGVVAWRVTLAATEAADAASFTATARHTGVLAATESSDSASFVGLGAIIGALAAAEARDQAIFVGGPVVAGELAATEAADRCSIRAYAGRVTSGEANPRPPYGVAVPRPFNGVAAARTESGVAIGRSPDGTAAPRTYSGVALPRPIL